MDFVWRLERNMIRGVSAATGKMPGQVSGVSATAGDGQAVVSFTAPSYTGRATLTYTVTASPGGATASGSSSPITVTGLSNGTSYTFTVTANASYGVNSVASAASGSVTPVAPPYFPPFFPPYFPPYFPPFFPPHFDPCAGASCVQTGTYSVTCCAPGFGGCSATYATTASSPGGCLSCGDVLIQGCTGPKCGEC